MYKQVDFLPLENRFKKEWNASTKFTSTIISPIHSFTLVIAFNMLQNSHRTPNHPKPMQVLYVRSLSDDGMLQ